MKEITPETLDLYRRYLEGFPEHINEEYESLVTFVEEIEHIIEKLSGGNEKDKVLLNLLITVLSKVYERIEPEDVPYFIELGMLGAKILADTED